jgi:hypothetical protein
MAERWQQWMPHDIDSWQGSANVQALSDLAYRAVHNLILDMWKQVDCALPDEDRELAKRSRVAGRWNECRDEVMDYFTDRTEDGKITHRVTRKKWSEAHEIYEKRQQAAKKTNASRSVHGDRDGDRIGDRDVSAPLTPRNADTGTQTRTQTSTRTEVQVSKTSSSHPEPSVGAVVKHPDFSIYEAYPRKESKREAMTAINKAVARLMKGEAPHAPMAKIDAQRYLMRRVLEYERSPVGRQADKIKIPHPATWFNGSRYDDDQSNWHHTEKQNGTAFKSKSESTIEALHANHEGRRNRDPFGDVVSSASGECEEAGIRPVYALPDAIRVEAYQDSDRAVVIEATR